MRIAIIGPGIMSIPPKGWGAVEILIWDMSEEFIRLGHETKIINTKDPNKILEELSSFNPDFVHIQYDDFIGLIPHINKPCAITSHFGYLEQPSKHHGFKALFDYFGYLKPNVFCLSDGIKNTYKNLLNFPEEKLFVTPNGVNEHKFNYKIDPKFADKSIYLAKIDYRKRQHKFQKIDSIMYAGNIADSRFDPSKNYLGEWDKDTLYKNLTDYANLILLSDGEAHALVCMEAMCAGLGLVISEYATANLDLSKPWIHVIPENKMDDIEYIENVVNINRSISLENRENIRDYCLKNHTWNHVIKTNYLPSMEKIINEQS